MTTVSFSLPTLLCAGAIALGSAVADAPKETSMSMPFKLVRNMIWVEASINDSGPLHFIVDTGAGRTLIEAQRAKKLGLKSEGTVAASGAGDKVIPVSWATVSKMSLGDAILHNLRVICSPLSSIPSRLGCSVDGIIGYDILSRYVVDIDYAASRLTFVDPSEFHDDGLGVSVPFDLYMNIPRIHATIVYPDHSSHKANSCWIPALAGQRQSCSPNRLRRRMRSPRR